MSREMTAVASGAITLPNVTLAVLVEMDFSGGFLRVNNSAMNLNWNSLNWIGVGQLGKIDNLTESADMEAHSLSFSISGIPQENIATALDQDYQGRSCKVWFATLDTDYQVISDPIGSFNYKLDTMDIELGDKANIKVTAQSRLVDWERSLGTRYTNEEQQRVHPGDLGLEFVPQMAEKRITWGFI